MRLFGYIKPYRPELLVREDGYYRMLYCGLCAAMRKNTGRLSSFSLSYDFVFLVLVRSLTDGTVPTVGRHRCILHPFRPIPMAEPNPTLTMVARLSAVLSYYKLRDDLRDSGFRRRFRARMLLPVFARARRLAAISEPEAEIRRCLDTLHRLECEKSPSVDAAADAFGGVLAAVFSAGTEGRNRILTCEIGRAVGRFIYAADALEDYEADRKSGDYNPYVLAAGGAEQTDADKASAHTALLLTLTPLEQAIDLLPDDRAEIRGLLRNILYRGLPERLRFLGDIPTARKEPDHESGSL